jgi:HSP20 family protein
MQTPSNPSKKSEEIVRVRRESGPLSFAEPSSPFPSAPRLPEGLAYAAYATPLAQPFAVAAPGYGLPSAPSYGNLPFTATPFPTAGPAFLHQAYPNAAWGTGLHPQFASLPRLAQGAQPYASTQQRMPLCDVVDEGAEYTVQVELPGIKREGVDVSCYEQGILVTAFAEPEIDVGALVQAERGLATTFRRAIQLPNGIQPSGAKATLHDGVLTISLPKANPTEGPRRVPVN